MNEINSNPRKKISQSVKSFSDVENKFEDIINLLYSRLMPVVGVIIQLKTNKSHHLKNFLYFIKSAPSSLELLPSIKFNYIRSHAIQRAKKAMRSYEETLCNFF